VSSLEHSCEKGRGPAAVRAPSGSFDSVWRKGATNSAQEDRSFVL
jgi:hypothetical protein